ncbi:uncharacterized protein LOC125204448 [Salvia hispanica]|uniref:uncharacterized protein LOC125204448 n=1 Tax=Salvia hispanica TaxID=49212 RepID=UPI0020096902|nr:uncharacterized protein LOC125204448 [Salvia hispanica]XP_047959067.1 uncharacterized protein LOC125204448 [Salvia hispanica]XP_047959069.1 uncharacterized protein LOC125204448 [Salvia hispanica]
MATISLPRVIVIKSKVYGRKGHAYFKADGASVVLGEEDIFSTLVKIDVERSITNAKYVNLKFGYFNRYWRRKENDKFIIAESNQAEEDVSKPSCTLFEPVKVDDAGVFYFRHVQSGGRVLMDASSMRFYVDEKAGNDDKSYLTFVDWNTILKLPSKVAFKGNNGKYLFSTDTATAPLFKAEDPNDERAIFIVEMKPDGHVRIIAPAWFGGIYGFSLSGLTGGPEYVVMYAQGETNKLLASKIDENSIALRSTTNNNFCRVQYIAKLNEYFLCADTPTITDAAKLKVEERVLERKIYNVMYQMEYARIFNEVPYVAGSSVLINDKPLAASMQAEVEYTDERSYSFSRSQSLTAGFSTTIEASVPFIASVSITAGFEINRAFQWDETTTTSTTVKGTAMVPVPAMSSVTVDYVGTRGTCNIPFSYTQEDRSSYDAQISYTDHVDGTYTGVSYYSFSFHVRETKSL